MTQIDVISDPVCPWCYLGAANLMRAVAERYIHLFALRWIPYQLDPTLPPEGLDRVTYMAAKFGSRDLAAAHDRLTAMGVEAGITYYFDRITRAPNTINAHRLLHWAAAEGVQTRCAMMLFRRHFELGDDISDPSVLTEVAVEAGLDRLVIARLLAGDVDRDTVAAEAEAAREMGVTGVPTFILGGRYVLTGAQSVQIWRDVIDQLAGADPTSRRGQSG